MCQQLQIVFDAYWSAVLIVFDHHYWHQRYMSFWHMIAPGTLFELYHGEDAVQSATFITSLKKEE